MSTITAPLPHAPRSLRSRVQPVSIRLRRSLRLLQRINEGLDSDRNASLSELTMRPYGDIRFR